MSNRSDAEKYFYDEYKSICQKLYSDYMVGLEKRLSREGLSHVLLMKNGTAERLLAGYVKDIFSEYSKDIVSILDVLKEEFEVFLTDKFINEFEVVNGNNIDSHMEVIEEKIKNVAKCELKESTKSSLVNIKQNVKNNTINDMKKKNESIKRLLKKEKRKDGFLSRLKNATLESSISWLVPFVLGLLVANFTKIINFFENVIIYWLK